MVLLVIGNQCSETYLKLYCFRFNFQDSVQWHTISKSEIELIDYIVKILGTWKEALSVYYMRQMHSTLALREAERSNLVFSCSWRDGIKWGNGFLYFQICRMFPLRAGMALGVYIFRVLWFTQKERYLLLMESCRGITYLLRTNNFVIVLGSEFAHESPWHITLHSFSSSAVLGENQKKFVLFMLKAVMYSARNHGYGDCREAPTQPHQVQP